MLRSIYVSRTASTPIKATCGGAYSCNTARNRRQFCHPAARGSHEGPAKSFSFRYGYNSPIRFRQSSFVKGLARTTSVSRFRHSRLQRDEICTLILQTVGFVFRLTRCCPCTGQTTSQIFIAQAYRIRGSLVYNLHNTAASKGRT